MDVLSSAHELAMGYRRRKIRVKMTARAESKSEIIPKRKFLSLPRPTAMCTLAVLVDNLVQSSIIFGACKSSWVVFGRRRDRSFLDIRPENQRQSSQ
jgi:hypothetical protein